MAMPGAVQVMGRQELFALIRVMRPLLIILICWAHIPFISGFYSDEVDAFSPRTVFGVLLRDVVSRGGVPILTVISGYLAYLSLQRKSYITFVGEKTRRILLPYLLWNVICLVYLWWLSRTFDYAVNSRLFEYGGVADFVNAILAINRMPVNSPIYFLRDLFLIFLFCPLFDLLSRNRIVAVSALVLYSVYMLNTVTPIVAGYGILYRSDMPFFFLLGYLASRHDLAVPVFPRRVVIAGFASLVVLSVATAFYLAYAKPDLLDYLEYRPVIGMVYLLALPCLMSFLLPRTNGVAGQLLAKLATYSMVIFLSHQLLAHTMRSLVPWLGISIGNHSPIVWQVLFLLVYTGLCVLVGVVLKALYTGGAALLGYARPVVRSL